MMLLSKQTLIYPFVYYEEYMEIELILFLLAVAKCNLKGIGNDVERCLSMVIRIPSNI